MVTLIEIVTFGFIPIMIEIGLFLLSYPRKINLADDFIFPPRKKKFIPIPFGMDSLKVLYEDLEVEGIGVGVITYLPGSDSLLVILQQQDVLPEIEISVEEFEEFNVLPALPIIIINAPIIREESEYVTCVTKFDSSLIIERALDMPGIDDEELDKFVKSIKPPPKKSFWKVGSDESTFFQDISYSSFF